MIWMISGEEDKEASLRRGVLWVYDMGYSWFMIRVALTL